MSKDEIRKVLINKRKKLFNKKELSTIIVNKIIDLDIYNKARVIALYNSLKEEVDTSILISKSLKNKKVLLPKIIDNKMKFIIINNESLYEKSNIGVLEPIGEIYNGKIDLIIVPGVAFDKKLNRLGFGMGYYDKYLINNKSFKIGICFSEQIVDSLPIDKYDIKMDMVITN